MRSGGWSGSLDRTHREAADHPLLGHPPGDDHREAGDHGGGRQLGDEVAARAHVAGDPDRDRLAVDRVELDGEEVLVPGEDQAEERGGGDAGKRDRQDHRQEHDKHLVFH